MTRASAGAVAVLVGLSIASGAARQRRLLEAGGVGAVLEHLAELTVDDQTPVHGAGLPATPPRN